MRKKAIPLAIFLFAFLSAGLLLSQKTNEDNKFKQTLEKYLDEHWKFYPTAATLAGYHKYDGKLEDVSSANLEKRLNSLDTFNQELVIKLNKLNLNPELQIDHEIIMDALDLERLKHENLVPWEYNPLFYNDIFDNCVRCLLIKEFAPIESRAKNVELRLKELPRLIKQAKENLKNPPQIFTETAIRQFSGIMDFYKKELPQLLEKVPADIKSRLQENLAKLIPVLEDYQNFLKNELLPRSTGNFRLGQDVHTRLLRMTLQNSIPLQELGSRANADINNIRREMAMICLGIFRIMYPNINMEQLTAQKGEEEMRNITVRGVIDKIKAGHSTKDEFINQAKTLAEEIKSFITQNQLIELPEEKLNVEPMPLVCQGITLTRLVPPGIYETSGPYTLQIAPIPEDWGEDQTKSFLEEYNNSLLPFWTVGEVYPGQFVPVYFTRKYPSIARSLFPSMPLIKGWPAYIEEVLITSGFKDYDMKLRLNQLKLQLRAAIDFLVEINVHSGGMTKEQAILLMTGKGFATQAEAERRWNRIILKPADSAFDYVGNQEILDLQKEYKNLKGESFSQKEFLAKLLSYGALPIRHLKNKMLSQ